MIRSQLRAALGTGLLSVLLVESALTSARAEEKKASDEAVALDPFSVVATKDRAYNSRNSVGAGRISVPLNELPQAVTVLNEEFLTDTGTFNVYEAAKYIAGFAAAAAPDSGSYTIRGLNLTSPHRDGFADATAQLGTQFDNSALFDRVEVIKGPSGVLYGQHVGGGVINRITKRPLGKRRSAVKVSFGDVDLKRVMFDTTGPLTNQLNFRLIAMVQDAENWVGSRNDHEMLHGGLSHRIAPHTSLYFSFTFDHPASTINTPNLWGGPGSTYSTFLPRKTSWLADRDQINEERFRAFDLEFHHSVLRTDNNDFTMRLKLRFIDNGGYSPLYLTVGNPNYLNSAGVVVGNINTISPLNPNWATFVANRQVQVRNHGLKTTQFNFDMAGGIKLAPVTLRLLAFGGGVFTGSFSKVTNYDVPQSIIVRNNPVRPLVANPGTLWSNANLVTNSNNDSVQGNGGGLLTAEAFEKQLIVTGGGRYDWNRTTGTNFRLTTNAVSETSNQQWSKRYGAVIRPKMTRGISAYYSYAETFAYQGGFDARTGLPVKNQIASVNEVGLRGEFLDGRLLLSAARYKAKISNNSVNSGLRDPVTNLSITLYQDSTNDGTEFEAWLSLTDNWSLVSTFSNVKSRTAAGLRARGVPQGNSYTLWTKYDFRQGFVQGLGVGGGFVHTASRAADGADTITLPTFDQVDAVVSYRIRSNWKAQLNVYNLLNTDKPYAGTSAPFIYRVLPRRMRVSIDYTF